jgi:hypothetical protein
VFPDPEAPRAGFVEPLVGVAIMRPVMPPPSQIRSSPKWGALRCAAVLLLDVLGAVRGFR